MTLLYITDNGFSEKEGTFYIGGADHNHSSNFVKYFENIIFVARKDSFDNSSIGLQAEVYLFSKYDVIGLRKKIKQVMPRVDAVLCNGINGAFAVKVAKKENKAIIAYCGGDTYDFLICRNTLAGRIAAPIIRELERYKFKNADYAHYCASFLVDRYPCQGAILVCSGVHVVCDEKVLEDRIKRINQFRGGMDAIIIGLIGHLKNGLKGVDIAIRALSQLDERYLLQIVGRGSYEAYMVQAKQLGVENRVQFLGAKKAGEEVMKWLDQIDLYIQPSLVEGLPRATIEAMSRGCPVVSTDAGALQELIALENIVKIKDDRALANRIGVLSADCAKMLEQATKNFEKAKQYEQKVKRAKYDIFYKQVIKELRNNEEN